ncbi:DNA polymerase eta [Perkinsela sp. CCAP 1560/4]|nr:DNA polymerase eta [Perkinsela sp. CCAP 1560/4]|eukprot:KNH06978.1 DNA polymerase eta [Perkinsela sp. CCAP 1560/4]
MDEVKLPPHSFILHIDLDCFYSQVEQLRLKSSYDEPFAVHQWGSILAVNYEARRHGVKRMMTLNQARKLCPNLSTVHTATIALGSTEPEYHKTPSKATHKVSLQSYRIASEKIHAVLRRVAGPDSVYQRAGTDEAFIDVTTRVRKEILSGVGAEYEKTTKTSDCPGPCEIWVLPNNAEDLFGWRIAARICSEMRTAVKTELGYNCSAGVSFSKIVSKLLSAEFKPNKQATLTPLSVEEFMRHKPIQKISGFGGLFGEKVTQLLNIKWCGDLWEIPRRDLLRKFDLPTIEYILSASRGVDAEEAVRDRPQSKSILAAKIFPASHDVMSWVHVLVAELDDRVSEFVRRNSNVEAFASESATEQNLKMSYPKSITLVLKWIEVEQETEECYEKADNHPKTLTRTFPFQVPPKSMLSSDAAFAGESRVKLLQNVLSNVELLMGEDTANHRFTSISICILNFVECSLSREEYTKNALPDLHGSKKRKTAEGSTTLDNFLSGKKPTKPFKTETDAAGRVWIDLT